MRTITVKNLLLQFDSDQITTGNESEQARQAIELVNLELQRQPFGLSAQLIISGGMEIDSEEMESRDEMLEACRLAREALTPARNDEEMTAMNALNKVLLP